MIILGRSHDALSRGAKTPGGLSEWEIAEDVNQAIVDELRNRIGSRTCVVRFGGTLKNRVKSLVMLARVARYDCAVECHCNAFPSDSGKSGYSVIVWHNSKRSIHLADCILDELARVRQDAVSMGINKASSTSRWIGTGQEYTNAPGLALLEDTPCPAVVVEACYLTNPDEAGWISELENRKSIGWAIARGLDRWLTERKERIS